jgi:S-adenosylmethionine synthetase
MSKTLKVSESVCAGHPDKLADQISDTVLDEALKQDPNSRVAIETLVAKDTVIMAGELTTNADLNYEEIAKKVITDNGYVNNGWGFSNKAHIITKIHRQSTEIAKGVDNDGAGDQGLMYGYACNETEQYMPLPITIAHDICRAIDESRVSLKLPYLRPDGKSQVVIEYQDDKPVAIKHLTVAVPHDENITKEELTEGLINKVLIPIINQKYKYDLPSEIIINGTGIWHIPGPASDVGLTGRKIVVDTYGGASKVGGGAFSGKDATKVDRSGAYASRYIAKNIVAHGLATRAEVCLAYYIGAKKPIILSIDTFGTSKFSHKGLIDFSNSLIDTSVKGIINKLDLTKPIYSQTSAYGHFGKGQLTWEKINNNVKI